VIFIVCLIAALMLLWFGWKKDWWTLINVWYRRKQTPKVYAADEFEQEGESKNHDPEEGVIPNGAQNDETSAVVSFLRALPPTVAFPFPWAKATLMVNAYQVLALLPSAYRLDLPPIFDDFMAFLSVPFSLDFGAFQCWAPHNFHGEVIFVAFAPIVIAAGILCVRASKSAEREKQTKNVLASAVLYLAYFVVAPVSIKIFQSLQCESFEDGSSYLIADYSIDCDSDEHTSFEVLAYLLVLAYPIGIPAAIWLLLWRSRETLNPNTSEVLVYFARVWKLSEGGLTHQRSNAEERLLRPMAGLSEDLVLAAERLVVAASARIKVAPRSQNNSSDVSCRNAPSPHEESTTTGELAPKRLTNSREPAGVAPSTAGAGSSAYDDGGDGRSAYSTQQAFKALTPEEAEAVSVDKDLLQRALISPECEEELKAIARAAHPDYENVAVLTKNFAPRFWWFEVYECWRRLLLTGFFALFAGGKSTQLAAATMVSLAATFGLCKMRPYRQRGTNSLAEHLQWALSLTLFGSLLQRAGVTLSEGYNMYLFGSALVAINLSPLHDVADRLLGAPGRFVDEAPRWVMRLKGVKVLCLLWALSQSGAIKEGTFETWPFWLTSWSFVVALTWALDDFVQSILIYHSEKYNNHPIFKQFKRIFRRGGARIRFARYHQAVACTTGPVIMIFWFVGAVGVWALELDSLPDGRDWAIVQRQIIAGLWVHLMPLIAVTLMDLWWLPRIVPMERFPDFFAILAYFSCYAIWTIFYQEVLEAQVWTWDYALDERVQYPYCYAVFQTKEPELFFVLLMTLLVFSWFVHKHNCRRQCVSRSPFEAATPKRAMPKRWAENGPFVAVPGGEPKAKRRMNLAEPKAKLKVAALAQEKIGAGIKVDNLEDLAEAEVVGGGQG